MGTKDATEKMLADYNDVFADIVNVLLFNGKEVVQPDDLENVKDKNQYKADDNKIHEQERDLSKIVKSHGVRISLVGIENQTKIDEDMPFRVIGYDGASYRSQLLGNKKERYPVITLVLYYGEKKWDKNTTLLDSMNVSSEWKPFVNDYALNIFEISHLSYEQVQMFKSDFRIVADFFVQQRKSKSYRPKRETIKHVDAILKLMSILTKDNRFEQAQNQLTEGGDITMCEVLDVIENEGIRKGELKGKVEILLEDGYTVEEIAERLQISTAQVEDVIASLS